MKAVYSDDLEELFEMFPDCKKMILTCPKPFEIISKKPDGLYKLTVGYGLKSNIIVNLDKLE